MSCSHTDATLAWLYGEGDEAHLTHVGRCPECQSLVAEHEEVLAAVAPVMPSIERPGGAPVVVPEPANRPMWMRWSPALALAAAALITALVFQPGSHPETQTRVPPPVPVASLELTRDVDLGLDDLDAELDDLFADLEAL